MIYNRITFGLSFHDINNMPQKQAFDYLRLYLTQGAFEPRLTKALDLIGLTSKLTFVSHPEEHLPVCSNVLILLNLRVASAFVSHYAFEPASFFDSPDGSFSIFLRTHSDL